MALTSVHSLNLAWLFASVVWLLTLRGRNICSQRQTGSWRVWFWLLCQYLCCSIMPRASVQGADASSNTARNINQLNHTGHLTFFLSSLTERLTALQGQFLYKTIDWNWFSIILGFDLIWSCICVPKTNWATLWDRIFILNPLVVQFLVHFEGISESQCYSGLPCT